MKAYMMEMVELVRGILAHPRLVLSPDDVTVRGESHRLQHHVVFESAGEAYRVDVNHFMGIREPSSIVAQALRCLGVEIAYREGDAHA